MGRYRWLGLGLVIGALLAAPMGLGSCAPLRDLLGIAPPSVEKATPTVPARQPPTPPPAPARPAAPTPTPPGSVTQREAQSVVRAWFDALAAEDYQRMEELTTGSARTRTRQATETIRSEAEQRGVRIDLVVQRLDLSPGSRPRASEAVQASFDIQANAVVGPFSVTARTIEGSATFVVERVNGEARITDIQNVTGLPTQ